MIVCGEIRLLKTMPKLIAEMDATLKTADVEITQVANKFIAICNYEQTNNADIRNNTQLMERVSKGAKYFVQKTESLIGSILNKTDVDIDRKETAKQLSEQREQLSKDIEVKKAELKHVATNGFDVQDYLKARAKAILDSEQSKKETSKSSVKMSSDIKNKDLYVAIVKWRSAKADELNVEAYQILTQKSVIGISQQQPLTIAELKKVNGIGSVKAKQFGDELIKIVEKHTSKK